MSIVLKLRNIEKVKNLISNLFTVGAKAMNKNVDKYSYMNLKVHKRCRLIQTDYEY